MGQSTNGILAYGIPIEDGEVPPGSMTEEEWEDLMEDWDDKYGVEVVFHCSCEYEMYFIAVKGTEQVAYRGDPIRTHREVGKVEFDKWFSFMTDYNIDVENRGWYLMSMWC